jgi:hypothetical protein
MEMEGNSKSLFIFTGQFQPTEEYKQVAQRSVDMRL